MYIQITGTSPIAEGLTRRVYPHPDDDRLLIKVIRPDRLSGPPMTFRWYQKRRRYRHLSSFLHEIREHLVVCVHEGAHRPHLQNIVGLVDTELGCGLVTEALRDRDGGYALTLAQLVKQGAFDEVARRELQRFLDWLRGSMIVVNDLQLCNVVYAWDASGRSRFVLVDGIGEGATVPLRSLFDRVNQWAKRRAIAAFEKRLQHKLAG